MNNSEHELKPLGVRRGRRCLLLRLSYHHSLHRRSTAVWHNCGADHVEIQHLNYFLCYLRYRLFFEQASGLHSTKQTVRSSQVNREIFRTTSQVTRRARMYGAFSAPCRIRLRYTNISCLLSCKRCASNARTSGGERSTASNYRRPNYSGFYTSVMDQQIGMQQDGNPLDDAKPGEKKGGVIFYSRLAGYPENRPTPDKAKMYAGVVVPARPEEPLNCCQSGCVHCVWDIYREDIEDYEAKKKEAREALTKSGKTVPVELGGSGEPDIIGQLSPSLQAFIKLEKQLKEKRERKAAK